MQAIEVLQAECLSGIPHGFLGRTDHSPEGAAAAVLPGLGLVRVEQVHSAKAVAVTEPWRDDARPEADAIVTDRPGLALGIVTADCAPVLLADRQAGIIAAAHAGWKGAQGGIVEATIADMLRLGAERGRIAAAIGPCIAQHSYEVDEAFRRGFEDNDEDFFRDGRTGHYQFDLEAYVASRLTKAGIGYVEALSTDTYAEESRFHSYRRAKHRGEPDHGRQVSAIALPA